MATCHFSSSCDLYKAQLWPQKFRISGPKCQTCLSSPKVETKVVLVPEPPTEVRNFYLSSTWRRGHGGRVLQRSWMALTLTGRRSKRLRMYTYMNLLQYKQSASCKHLRIPFRHIQSCYLPDWFAWIARRAVRAAFISASFLFFAPPPL